MKKRIIALTMAAFLIITGTAIIPSASIIKQQIGNDKNINFSEFSTNKEKGEIKVTTDKQSYQKGEPIDITITNIGEIPVAGYAQLDIYTLPPDGGYTILIFRAMAAEIPDLYSLNPGESYTYTWDQKDTYENQVDVGEYTVYFTFTMCGGPNARNYTNFMINEPPNPPVIKGPTSGERWKTYTFDITVSDPDGDDLQMLEVDFGDAIAGVIIPNWHSGDTTQVSHKWKRTGSFQIKARVQDIHGAWSDWGSSEISIPKSAVHRFFIFEKLGFIIYDFFQ